MASPRPKLSARLPPAGEHPAKHTSAEMDLQVVSIVNGYRQPQLLRVETGSAEGLLGDDSAAIEALLSSALAKMETIEKKRQFRRDNGTVMGGALVVAGAAGGAARPGTRPDPGFGAAVDKGAFFSRLASPVTPLEEVFQLPKLGAGLFMSLMAEKTVPPVRALWAVRAAYPNLSSRDLAKEFLEKVIRIGEQRLAEAPQLEYSQSLMALALAENAVAVTDLFEVAFRRDVFDAADKSKKMTLCQFVSPFLGLLYNEKPRLLLAHVARVRQEFGSENDSLLSLPRAPRAPDMALFDDEEQAVAAVCDFVAARWKEPNLAALLEQQRFAVGVEPAVVTGVLHFGLRLWNGSAASLSFAAKFVLRVLWELKRVPRPVVLESLFRFSQQRLCVFSSRLWSDLIRQNTVSFDEYMRLLTLSAVAAQDAACVAFAAGLSCPPQSRRVRAIADDPANAQVLPGRVSSFLNGEGEMDAVFAGATEFDLDALWPVLRDQMDREAQLPAQMSVRELTQRVERQHRLLDCCLSYPGGLDVAARLVEVLHGSNLPIAKGLLVSAMSRLWPLGMCPSVKSQLVAAFSAPPQQCVWVTCSDDDECVAVALRGAVAASHALCALALAMQPQMMQSLVSSLQSFDSLCFLSEQFATRWQECSHPHWTLWKVLTLGPVVAEGAAGADASAVFERPEMHSMWTVGEMGGLLTAEQAKRACVVLAERIGKEKMGQKIKTWVALLQALKKRPDIGTLTRVCGLVVPAALSYGARVLFARSDHAAVVAAVCGLLPVQSFETCVENVESPDEVALAGLERALPLQLAVVLQCRIVERLAAKSRVDPFVTEGKARMLAVLREPANVVRGWHVHTKQAPLTLLARSMDEHGETEAEPKRAKLEKS